MDYYLEDKSRLRGQPKRTIADYVEQNGILVPVRFNSLEQARSSGLPIFLRSEHPQEYDGASGVLCSFSLEETQSRLNNSQTLEDVKETFFRDFPDYWFSVSNEFCRLSDLPIDEFRKDVSFSAWEKLEGVNRTVMADTSIRNRYHIMTCKDEEGSSICNYTIFENGKVERQFLGNLEDSLLNGLSSLVDSYEIVRNLPRFDKNHCPIMEFQTVAGEDYFLQYHRGRDFSETLFELNREKEEGEIEVPFVRGATRPHGEKLNITVYYKENCDKLEEANGEDGSFEYHTSLMFTELQTRKRKLEIIAKKDLRHAMLGIVSGHSGRSRLFKSEVSVIMNGNTLVSDDEITEYFNKRSRKNRVSLTVDVYLISDGRRAFVKRI